MCQKGKVWLALIRLLKVVVVVNLEKNPISAFYVGNNEVLSRYIPIVRARKQIIKQSILHRWILTSHFPLSRSAGTENLYF